MNKIINLLKRMPTWGWIALVALQLLNICLFTHRASDIADSIEHFKVKYADVSAWRDDIIQRFSKIRDGEINGIIGGAIASVVFGVLAIWSWNRRRNVATFPAPHSITKQS